MSVQARAFWIVEPGRGEIREEPLPEPGPGEVRIRTLFSGISRGTESLVFDGRVPESQRAVMRAPFQRGEFPGPVKYGYATVGVVEAGDGQIGSKVFCLYPHQDCFVVPTRAVVPVPEGVPAGRAVLAANMETALNAVWDASPGVGDQVVIVGAGVIGCLVAWIIAQIPGTRVQLVDVNPRRSKLAQALGATFAGPSRAWRDVDLVVHASGTPAGLTTALGLAGFEATVLELSWFGDTPVSVPLGEAFHSRRLRLIASQVGAINRNRRDRWTHRHRQSLALEFLKDPVFEQFITGECGFDELPTTMAILAGSPGDTLCHRVRYTAV
jgi:threonine dehydrogenase-like Zn-dependent dehydrogenase